LHHRRRDFAALLPKFRRAGADVLGVSRDSARSHENFCNKQDFGFELISDADEVLCQAFDVIREKQLYGRKYIGVDRSTFLVAPDGHVAQQWRGVKVPGHARPCSKFAVPSQGNRMTRSKRIYVLDTNVLMHDPTALFKFERTRRVPADAGDGGAGQREEGHVAKPAATRARSAASSTS
jgi:hypothetical protein